MLSTICWSLPVSPAVILTRLWREVTPEMISTADFGTWNRSARNSRQSLLAAPSTGGDVRRIFRACKCGGNTPVLRPHPVRGRTDPLKRGMPIQMAMGIGFVKDEIGDLVVILLNCAADLQTDIDHLMKRRKNFRMRSNKLGLSFASSEPIILKAESVTLPVFSFMAAEDFMTIARKSPSPT